MESYLAQKADEALKELCQEAPFARRFQLVLMHLRPLASARVLSTAPPAVVEAMNRLVSITDSADDESRAFAARRAISTILEAWGHQEGKRMEAAQAEAA